MDEEVAFTVEEFARKRFRFTDGEVIFYLVITKSGYPILITPKQGEEMSVEDVLMLTRTALRECVEQCGLRIETVRVPSIMEEYSVTDVIAGGTRRSKDTTVGDAARELEERGVLLHCSESVTMSELDFFVKKIQKQCL